MGDAEGAVGWAEGMTEERACSTRYVGDTNVSWANLFTELIQAGQAL